MRSTATLSGYGVFSAESSRACRAAAESALVNALLTAFAPGILDAPRMLSFSRWVSCGLFWSESSLLQAAAPAASTTIASEVLRSDKRSLQVRWACWLRPAAEPASATNELVCSAAWW